MNILNAVALISVLHVLITAGILWLTNLFLPEQVATPYTWFNYIGVFGATFIPYLLSITAGLYKIISTEPKPPKETDS